MEEMKTVNGEIVKVGECYYFEELWDGYYDGQEILESEAVSTDNVNVAEFVVVKENEDILKTLVKVTNIY